VKRSRISTSFPTGSRKDSRIGARRRLSTSDVERYDTPVGAAKANDEMRRIQSAFNDLASTVEGLTSPEQLQPLPTTTTVSPPTEQPEQTPITPLVTKENGVTRVSDTKKINFVDSDTTNFEVRKVGTNQVDVAVHALQDLSVGVGALGGLSHDYDGQQGMVNSPDTKLLWYYGDNYQFEGMQTRKGYGGSTLPTRLTIPIVDNKDTPLKTGNPYYGKGQTVRHKIRVVPLLNIWDKATRDDSTVTSYHTTRIEAKDTPRNTVRVTPHVEHQHAVEIRNTIIDYSVRVDTPYQRINTGLSLTKVVAQNSWEQVYYTIPIIEDIGNWFRVNTGALPLSHFTPTSPTRLNTHPYTFCVNAFLHGVGRLPTANTDGAVVEFPELALFKNDTYYSTLAFDGTLAVIGQIRAWTLDRDEGSSATITDNPTRFTLHGTDIISLLPTDRIDIRWRHKSPDARYVVFTYGYVSVHLVSSPSTQITESQPDSDLSML